MYWIINKLMRPIIDKLDKTNSKEEEEYYRSTVKYLEKLGQASLAIDDAILNAKAPTLPQGELTEDRVREIIREVNKEDFDSTRSLKLGL